MVRRCIALIPVALALLSSSAFAHVELQVADNLAAGFAHPFSGADHLVATFAIGVMAAHWRSATAPALPICFIAALLVGLLLGQNYPLSFSTEPMVAGSLVVLGLLVVFRASLAVTLALISFAGLLHGYVHGGEMPGNVMAYSIGLFVASGVLHAIGALFVAITRRAHAVDIVGATGKAIAIAGCAMTMATIYA